MVIASIGSHDRAIRCEVCLWRLARWHLYDLIPLLLEFDERACLVEAISNL